MLRRKMERDGRRRELEVYRLEAACKDYLWGGEKLKSEYHITYSGTALAEAWMLSCLQPGTSNEKTLFQTADI